MQVVEEQTRKESDVDSYRTDLYSVGVILVSKVGFGSLYNAIEVSSKGIDGNKVAIKLITLAGTGDK